MSINSQRHQARSATAALMRAMPATLGLAAMMLASSCASDRADSTTTGSIPDDYRTKHPITLAEVQSNLDVPVGAGEQAITGPTRDLIKGFAQDYTSVSKSTLVVAIPAGAANSAAARRLSGAIRQSLVEYGVKPGRIVMSSYPAQSSDASAPVRLSFVAVKAITNDCGQWPTDMFGPSLRDNTNWENFGCANQQNLAAQIANPNDLVGPRGMSPIDAERRATVIDTYRTAD